VEELPFFGTKFKYAFEDGVYHSEMTDMVGNVHRQMLDLNEQKIKECIIALGYTPPEKENQPAAFTLAKYQYENSGLETHNRDLTEQVDALLKHCPHVECATCSEIICPHGHAFHFHHDGCPACGDMLE